MALIAAFVDFGHPSRTGPIPAATPYIDSSGQVRLIQCGDRLGTAIIIGKNKLMTAMHVSKQDECYDLPSGVLMTGTEVDDQLDFALLAADTGDIKPLAVTCDGFRAFRHYRSVGWAKGVALAQTDLDSSPFYSSATFTIPDRDYGHKVIGYTPSGHLRILWGAIYEGMSGGAVIDDDDRVVGMNNAGASQALGYSRELRDTPLCKNHLQ